MAAISLKKASGGKKGVGFFTVAVFLVVLILLSTGHAGARVGTESVKIKSTYWPSKEIPKEGSFPFPSGRILIREDGWAALEALSFLWGVFRMKSLESMICMPTTGVRRMSLWRPWTEWSWLMRKRKKLQRLFMKRSGP